MFQDNGLTVVRIIIQKICPLDHCNKNIVRKPGLLGWSLIYKSKFLYDIFLCHKSKSQLLEIVWGQNRSVLIVDTASRQLWSFRCENIYVSTVSRD